MTTSQFKTWSYPRHGLHAADARAVTRDILRGWHVQGEPADDVTLVVSELMGNAVRHTLGPVVILTLTLGQGWVMVEVFDGSPLLPVATAVQHNGESGRGLHIIEALSLRSGARLAPAGKVMWAQISCPDAPPLPSPLRPPHDSPSHGCASASTDL
jgi:anti-sigma regulatory factor (Ser/Thr protein kinase)